MDITTYIESKPNQVNALYSAIVDSRLDVIEHFIIKKGIPLQGVSYSDVEDFLYCATISNNNIHIYSVNPLNFNKYANDEHTIYYSSYCLIRVAHKKQNFEVAKYLVDYYNKTDKNMEDIFNEIARIKYLELIEYMFRNFTIMGYSALKDALHRNDDELIEILIKNMDAERLQPLYNSSDLLANNRINILLLFLEKVKDNMIIIKCIQYGHPELIYQFIDAGYSIDYWGGEALLYSIKNLDFKTSEYLISKKIKLSMEVIIKILREKIILCATKMMFLSYLVELSETNFDFNNNQFMLSLIIFGKRIKKTFNIIKYFIDRYDDVNKNNGELLQESVRFKGTKISKYLISKGASIHASNCFSLVLAVRNNDISFVRYLVNLGAYIYVNNDECFHHCLKNNNVKILKYILTLYPKKDIIRLLKNNREKVISLLLKTDLSKMNIVVEVLREQGIDIYDMIEKEA